MTDAPRVLVIKLGALGDFIQALGPMAAIKRHHAGARLTLLTTPPFAAFARATGYFDEVWLDERPPLWRLGRVLALRRRLNAGRFDRVYDLQTSDRSSFYFRLFAPRPEWSGIARGCSHPHANPGRDAMHTVERQRDQLAMAGIRDVPVTDLSWLDVDVSRFALKPPYVLLVPGGSAHRTAKRWPTERYGELAKTLAARGYTVATIAAEDEKGVTEAIAKAAPHVRDLAGLTSFADIVALARRAAAAIGNDTGPMHLIAGAGCPAVVLFSSASDPALCAPRAPEGAAPVAVLRRGALADLSVTDVLAALRPRAH